MTPVEFPEHNIVFAKDQPEYLPLPAHVTPEGIVTVCWKLTAEELERVLVTGCVWQQIHTFRQPLQPHGLSALKPVFTRSS